MTHSFDGPRPLRRRGLRRSLGAASTLTASLVALACALALAACGSDDETTTTGGAAKSADVAAAKQAIAPFVEKPSAFPITTPLDGDPAGKRIAYMDCGTTLCGLLYALASPPAQALGMEMTRVPTGLTADSVNTAFNTVIEGDYDGAMLAAVQPSLFERGLDGFESKEIPLVTTGVTGGDRSRIPVMQTSEEATNRAARLLASWVVARNGADTDVVFYVTPEVTFMNLLNDTFTEEVRRLCPGCKVRSVELPAATLGTRSPSLVVDDLQAHPDTKTAVFAGPTQVQGLTSALKTAGIEIETLVNFPDPAVLELIQSGQVTAGLAIDLPVVAWTLVDSLARLSSGEPADPGAVADEPPMQFLTKRQLEGANVERGWTAYPDFAERFMKLWGVDSSAAGGGGQ
jgi:ribose transport system substrate-binding protein